jgi:putative transposase
VPCVFISIKQRIFFSSHAIQERFSRWIKPRTTSLLLGTFADMTRGKSELLAENALLRHQLIILRRQIKRPVYRKRDRLLLVLLARMVRTWKQALFLVQPETILRWHRELFRVFWKRKSRAHSRKPRLSPETITLIKEMAAHNRLWGAERIRGELLKLDIRVCKRTIQKYMKLIRTTRPRGQTWRTFLRHHAAEIWACDFLQVTDLFFRPLFAFFDTLVAVAKGHPCECDTLSDRSLGSAYRYERRLRMGKPQNISSGIMTAHSGRVLRAWPQRVASKCFERRTGRHERMPSANAFWGA